MWVCFYESHYMTYLCYFQEKYTEKEADNGVCHLVWYSTYGEAYFPPHRKFVFDNIIILYQDNQSIVPIFALYVNIHCLVLFFLYVSFFRFKCFILCILIILKKKTNEYHRNKHCPVLGLMFCIFF